MWVLRRRRAGGIMKAHAAERDTAISEMKRTVEMDLIVNRGLASFEDKRDDIGNGIGNGIGPAKPSDLPGQGPPAPPNAPAPPKPVGATSSSTTSSQVSTITSTSSQTATSTEQASTVAQTTQSTSSSSTLSDSSTSTSQSSSTSTVTESASSSSTTAPNSSTTTLTQSSSSISPLSSSTSSLSSTFSSETIFPTATSTPTTLENSVASSSTNPTPPHHRPDATTTVAIVVSIFIALLLFAFGTAVFLLRRTHKKRGLDPRWWPFGFIRPSRQRRHSFTYAESREPIARHSFAYTESGEPITRHSVAYTESGESITRRQSSGWGDANVDRASIISSVVLPEPRPREFRIGSGMSGSWMGSEFGTWSEESDSGDGWRRSSYIDRERAEAGLGTGLTYPASVWWRSKTVSEAGKSNTTISAAQRTAPIDFEMRDEKGAIWTGRMHVRNEDGDGYEDIMRGSFMGEKESRRVRDEEMTRSRGSETGNDVWEDPFTAGKRGTNIYMGSSEDERREGRWRNARSWVKGQVERVETRMGYNAGANGEGKASYV
ncbi:hypothetical protein ACMFMG_002302 [Clarireedia jacksonii]